MYAWVLLIVAGLFESGFAFCLGKMRDAVGAAGTVILGIVCFHEPASFLRLFFIGTLIFSVIGLKVVSH